MNSVALPATGTAATAVPAISAEVDIVRQAARGESSAFEELYRRHSEPAWRLAQAVSPDKDAAVTAFQEGFVRAVRSSRTLRRSGEAFRPHVLSYVYKLAADQAYDRTSGPAVARRQPQGGPDAALTDAAFRSLPERWRAAIWLTEVENMDSDRVAAVLGVSAGVAEQLIARGRKGLAGRFAQAHHEAPEHIGEVLRKLAIATPANLAETTTVRWAASGTDHLSSLAPVSSWLEEHAARPLSVAAGALVGLGLIGIGVVSGGGGVHSQVGATGTGSVTGAVPVSACLASCPAGANGAAAGSTSSGANAFAAAFHRLTTLTGQTLASGGGSIPGATGGTSGTGGTPTTPSTPTTPTTPSTPTGPTIPSVPSIPAQSINLGIGTLSVSSNGTLSLNLLNGTATATAGSGGAGATVGSTKVGPTSTTPTTNPISSTISGTTGSVTNTVNGTVSGTSSTVQSTTNTVTTTVTQLTNGL
jgi:DNA-directed RNA polymerase specialized sigma24 family protein